MDVIILIFIVYYIGQLARKNGLNVLRWRTRLAAAWLIAEIMVGGLSLYLTHNYVTASISGILASILSALIIFQQFKREVDSLVTDKEDENGNEQS